MSHFNSWLKTTWQIIYIFFLYWKRIYVKQHKLLYVDLLFKILKNNKNFNEFHVYKYNNNSFFSNNF